MLEAEAKVLASGLF